MEKRCTKPVPRDIFFLLGVLDISIPTEVLEDWDLEEEEEEETPPRCEKNNAGQC